MLTKAFAEQFAAEWIDAWNSHDLERILSHYTEDFEMSSPAIVHVMGERSGTLKGRHNVRAYWAKALARNPGLHFELLTTLVGVSSVTLYYNGVRGLSAEVFHFDDTGKIKQAFAHYAQNVLG